MKKATKILTIVFSSILALVIIAYAGLAIYLTGGRTEFYKASTKEFKIPLEDDFVPQGFHYDSQNGYYIISGYNSKDKPSPIYILNAENGEVIKKINLKKSNGNDFTGHSGGVAVYGDYLYIAGGSGVGVYVFDYSEICNAENNSSVKYLGKFSTKNTDDDYVGSSFVTVYENKIVIGEFYSDPKYPTHDSHKLTTPCGDNHGAFAVEFELDASYTYGINPTPLKLYSMREKVQGMAFMGGKIFLSTSQSFAPSYIYEYNASDLPSATYQILGHSVPFYYIESTALTKTYKCLPMAEELVIRNGKIYIMSEFACNKYILGKFTSAKWCYATDLSKN